MTLTLLEFTAWMWLQKLLHQSQAKTTRLAATFSPIRLRKIILTCLADFLLKAKKDLDCSTDCD
jgi:hypothetical protein